MSNEITKTGRNVHLVYTAGRAGVSILVSMNRCPRINKTERTDQLVELPVDRSAPTSLAITAAIKISANKKVMSSVKEGIEVPEEFRKLRLPHRSVDAD